jgi:hypothetical protein
MLPIFSGVTAQNFEVLPLAVKKLKFHLSFPSNPNGDGELAMDQAIYSIDNFENTDDEMKTT